MLPLLRLSSKSFLPIGEDEGSIYAYYDKNDIIQGTAFLHIHDPSLLEKIKKWLGLETTQ